MKHYHPELAQKYAEPELGHEKDIVKDDFDSSSHTSKSPFNAANSETTFAIVVDNTSVHSNNGKLHLF